jgi:hypothetical protein
MVHIPKHEFRNVTMLHSAVVHTLSDRWWRMVWRWERREVGPILPIGPRLPGKKECSTENGEKNMNLNYEFWAADLKL